MQCNTLRGGGGGGGGGLVSYPDPTVRSIIHYAVGSGYDTRGGGREGVKMLTLQ